MPAAAALRRSALALVGPLAASPAAAREDPPTPFSQSVTAAVPDWRAQDWRRGTLKLHSCKFTWQSDDYIELAPEEPAMGRDPQKAFDNNWYNAEADDKPVSMAVPANWPPAFWRAPCAGITPSTGISAPGAPLERRAAPICPSTSIAITCIPRTIPESNASKEPSACWC